MEEIAILDKEYFRPDEAAKLIGVHVDTIRRWIDDGKMIAHKTVGGHRRIHRSEILAKKHRQT